MSCEGERSCSKLTTSAALSYAGAKWKETPVMRPYIEGPSEFGRTYKFLPLPDCGALGGSPLEGDLAGAA